MQHSLCSRPLHSRHNTAAVWIICPLKWLPVCCTCQRWSRSQELVTAKTVISWTSLSRKRLWLILHLSTSSVDALCFLKWFFYQNDLLRLLQEHHFNLWNSDKNCIRCIKLYFCTNIETTCQQIEVGQYCVQQAAILDFRVGVGEVFLTFRVGNPTSECIQSGNCMLGNSNFPFQMEHTVIILFMYYFCYLSG